ncbi:MAG: hypothetical protein CM15mP66_01710 [Pseudomonadota bacterium]|nr:MAG: hypothetical protein CM15mP66_01710 [Pseudomonadota bacterium]
MMEAQQDLDFLTLTIMVSVIFLLAGTIKGTLGVGLPTTSVSVMALFLPPKIAIALVVFPILVTNFRQFFNAPNRKPVAIKFPIHGDRHFHHPGSDNDLHRKVGIRANPDGDWICDHSFLSNFLCFPKLPSSHKGGIHYFRFFLEVFPE